MNILVMNAGSSSQKMSLYKMGDSLTQLPAEPTWQAKLTVPWSTTDQSQWMAIIKEQLSLLTEGPKRVISRLEDIDIVGHRVVHGGTKYLASTIINETVKADIQSMRNLAPLHNEINLAGIVAVEKLLGTQVRQVAVFDTAFHRTIPLATSLYAVPYEWFEEYNIHKFGFHGINHQYCSERASQMLGKDPNDLGMIVCHLGSGCSLSAIQAGKSLDTTMGFTPLDGLMMSSRCGSIDPGVLIYLLKNTGMSVLALDEALNKGSGLKGVSRLTADMAIIIAEMKRGNENAKLAFDMYSLRIRQLVCKMRASLDRFDLLVFTAGVGENAPDLRQSVCDRLNFLGIELDSQLNGGTTSDGIISSKRSQIEVLVINAKEDWAIAHDCWQLSLQKSAL